jgi:hypothetical protein
VFASLTQCRPGHDRYAGYLTDRYA